MRFKKRIAFLLICIFSLQNIVVHAEEINGGTNISDDVQKDDIVDSAERHVELSTDNITINVGGKTWIYIVPSWETVDAEDIQITEEISGLVNLKNVTVEDIEDDTIREKVPANAVCYSVEGIAEGKTRILLKITSLEKYIDVVVEKSENNEEKEEPVEPDENLSQEINKNQQFQSNEFGAMQEKALKGWQEIDGAKYYFNNSGEKCTGITEISGVLYYFDENTGALKEEEGWIVKGEKSYYCNGNGVLFRNQFISFGEIYYFMGIDGSVQKGNFIYDGKLYHANNATGQIHLKEGWIEDGNKKYYADKEGVLFRNQFISFGDINYYMGSDGSVRKGNFEFSGKLFHANSTTGQVRLEEGWIEDDGKKYYAGKGGALYYNQFISFGNIYYYMTSDGSVQKGNFTLNGKLYHANNSTGQIRLQSGWIEDGSKKYYANEEGVLYHNQFISFGNIMYYMGSDGSIQKGIVKADNQLYYTNPDTGILRTKAGWIDYEGKRYYSNEKGILYNSQFISFGNIMYYMGSDGSVQKGIITVSGKVYYTDSVTGILQKKAGWIDYNGKRYYSNGEGVLYSNQFISFGNIMYYMGSDGSVQKGVVKAGNKVYYTDPTTGVLQRKAGWIDYNGKRYYSNGEGLLYSNQFISFGNIMYYMGSDGSVQKGVVKAGNKVYYTDPTTGVLQRKAGWIDYNGKRYYSNGEGVLYSNQFISFGNIMYYMGNDGSVQKGIVKAGNKVYYTDPDTGILQKKAGWIEQNGKRYFSNEEGVLYSNQLINFGNIMYYMGSDGSVQKGIVKCSGKLYYADAETGIIEMKQGWISYNGKKYYANNYGELYKSQFISFGINVYYMGNDGSMQTGYKQINGFWYYFDEKTGIMKREQGWFSDGVNTYYQKSNGTLATGYTDIGGVRYYFNNSGALSSKMGIDVSQWQGDINWSQVKSAGVEFAFIRVGYRGSATGKLAVDSYYKKNIEGALAANIKVGVYFFSQATTVQEAKEEATYTYNLIKNYNISFPVAFDTEFYDSAHSGRADKLDSSTRTLMANIFCSEIANYGYTPMVYSGTYFMNNHLQMSLLSKYQIWVAQYNSTLTYKGSYKCWQYSSTGRVNGINGNVDMNVWIN